MSVNDLLTALADELAAGDVPDVLGQSLTLAALWDDLARLAGEEPPADVLALLGNPPPITPADSFDRPAWVAARVAERER